ncbi:MAG: hypothetical protein D6731_08895, partial [Planctomycetota bacterium]
GLLAARSGDTSEARSDPTAADEGSPGPSGGASPGAASAASPDPPAARADPTRADPTRANEELAGLLAEEDPERQLRRATRWLQAYPAHPRAQEVRRLRARLRLHAPLARADLAPAPNRTGAELVWTAFPRPDLVVAFLEGDRRLQRWRWDAGSYALEPLPPLGFQGFAARIAAARGRVFVLAERPRIALYWSDGDAPLEELALPRGSSPPPRKRAPRGYWILSASSPRPGEWLVALSVAPRDYWVLSVDAAGKVRTVRRGKPPGRDAVVGLSLAPDGTGLLLCHAPRQVDPVEASARLLPLPAGLPRWQTSFPEPIRRPAWAADLLAVCSPWGHVYAGPAQAPPRLLLDPEAGSQRGMPLSVSHVGNCCATAVAPNGVLVTAAWVPTDSTLVDFPGSLDFRDAEPELKLWSPDGKALRRVGLPFQPLSLSVSLAGDVVAVGSRKRELSLHWIR